MSYQKWREQTISELGQVGIGYDLAVWLLRQASSLQTISERECSFEMSEREAARLERRSDSIVKRVTERLQEWGQGHTVNFQGDPRGCPFTITHRKPGEAFDREIGVVGRGLPARCFR